MANKLITLTAWAGLIYGDNAPHINTLRRWCRDGNILPLPKKHGRSYFVSERAFYVSHRDPNYMRMARESTAAS